MIFCESDFVEKFCFTGDVHIVRVLEGWRVFFVIFVWEDSFVDFGGGLVE